jgi:hypothetical protein
MRTIVRTCVVAGIAVGAIVSVLAGATAQRSAAAGQHLGVASCASTLCHGSARPTEAHNVQQNEYVTWSHFDPHSRAYRVLLEPQSRDMVRRLGIGPAHEEELCLDCHADNVPPQQRGPRFQLSDGVGCESCHGAAESWIATHYDTPRVTHADNVRNGLYPLEEPAARARLCLSCHAGSGERFAGHELMAAGHPRLTFELDTFTELWRTRGGREHYRRDEDYRARKAVPDGSEVWLTGLFESARVQLGLLDGTHFHSGGTMPDFALYNCYSCHRSMRFNFGGRGMAAGLRPGALRLDDSKLVMLSAVFAAMSPPDNDLLRERTARLHAAAAQSRQAVAPAGQALQAVLEAARRTLMAQPLTPEQKRRVLAELVRSAARGDYPDYSAAEQAAMAVVLLLAETGLAETDEEQALQPQIDALFAALAEDHRYDAGQFRQLLERVRR